MLAFRSVLKTALFISASLCGILCISLPCSAQVNEPDFHNPSWSQPYKPFRIAGNLYYVGTYELASYLITTPAGHILVNTGLAASADIISRNIEALGFKASDIKILLTNQAHFDHMGGMAAIQKMSDAQMMADEGDVAVIQDGGSSDYVLGGNGIMFQPLKVDRVLHNGDEITLGDMKLEVLHHPGHTRGSCSYLFTVKDDKRSYKVLLANMPKMLDDVNPAGMPGYPNVGKDFEYTYAAMPRVKFDLWLAPHASQFHLHDKHKEGDPYNPSAFKDRKGYLATIKQLHEEYLAKAGKQ